MNVSDDNDLMLVLHDIFEAVQTQRKCNAAAAEELLAEMVELVAEERGYKEVFDIIVAALLENADA